MFDSESEKRARRQADLVRSSEKRRKEREEAMARGNKVRSFIKEPPKYAPFKEQYEPFIKQLKDDLKDANEQIALLMGHNRKLKVRTMGFVQLQEDLEKSKKTIKELRPIAWIGGLSTVILTLLLILK